MTDSGGGHNAPACIWCRRPFDNRATHLHHRTRCSACGAATTDPPPTDEELAAAYDGLSAAPSADFPLLLISRRMKNTYNSTGPELSLLQRKGTTNPAFMHSQELSARNIADGEIVEVLSRAALESGAAQSQYTRSLIAASAAYDRDLALAQAGA